MKSIVLEKILNEKNVKLNEVIETVRNNPIFQEVMSNVKEQYFINDSIHGLSHNERVALLACYIGVKEGLNDDELRLVLEAAKYHDIGRGFEGNHGQNSAMIIDRNVEYILPDLNNNEINIIKALCHGHSVDDKQYQEIAELYGIENVHKFEKLLAIVKDADALDRVRLPRFGGLDEKYLRTGTAKEITDISKELFREYRTIQQNVVVENSKENRVKSNYEFNKGLRRGLLFDGENYYLIRSLNKADVENLDNGNGMIPKKDSIGEHTVQDVMAQIRMRHRKTNLISMSEDPNIVLTYDRANLHKFVLIKLSKDEMENSKKVFSAGEYLLGVMDYQIESVAQNAPKNVRDILERVESATSIDEIVKIINGADRQVSTSLVEREQQYLSREEQLEQSKKIAKCKVLNYYGLMRDIIHDENDKKVDISAFTQIMRNGYSSSEWLYSGKVEPEKIVNIPQILVDSLALVKQAEFQGKDKETLRIVEQKILELALSEREINQDNYQLEYSSHENLRNDLTIDKAFEITGGQISYRDTSMQMTAIRSLAEMTLNKRIIIELLQERLPNINISELLDNTYCVNQETTTRQNNRGNQIGKNVNFIISDYGYDLDDEIAKQILQDVQNLSNEQLANIISKGIDEPETTNLLVKLRERNERIQLTKSKGVKPAYIAEAIVEGYNWKKDGNLLTKQEKTLVVNRLLMGITRSNELYKLYKAINQIKIGKNKFTQNEVFAIMINLAIDRKIGSLSYSGLLKKEIREIQVILLENRETIQTEVLPISIDLIAGRGKKINNLKKELIDLGVEENFIEARDIKNIYVAKRIVDEYNFSRKLSDREKGAIIIAILKNSDLKKENTVYLSKFIQNMGENGFSIQEIYGIIINSAINGRAINKGDYNYSFLLSKAETRKKLAEMKNEVQYDVTEGTILRALCEVLDDEEIIDEMKKLGIEDTIIKEKDLKNLLVAKEIVEKLGRKTNPVEKKALIYALVKNSEFDKGNYRFLVAIMQNLESINLNEQQIVELMIKSSIGKVDINGTKVSIRELTYNHGNIYEILLKSNLPLEMNVSEADIDIAVNRYSGKFEDHRQNIYEILNFEEDEIKKLEFVDKRNVTAAYSIVENYKFDCEISKYEKKKIMMSILKNKILAGADASLLSTVIGKLNQNGIETQDIYGMIINLAINENIVDGKKIYSYTKVLGNEKDLLLQIKGIQDKTVTQVTETIILKACSQNLTTKEKKELIKSLQFEKMDEDYLRNTDVRVLYVANKIVSEYFGENIKEEQKKALIYAITNTTIQPYSLINLIDNMRKEGLTKKQIYGMIINLGINGSVTEESNLGYQYLLINKNNCCHEITKYKIDYDVSNSSILKAEVNILTDSKKENVRKQLLDMGIERRVIEQKNDSNLYVAKYIVDHYKFDRILADSEKIAIISKLLNISLLQEKYHNYIVELMNNIEKIGFNSQEIYGILINSAVNKSIFQEKGFSYSDLIRSKVKCKIFEEYKGKIKTEVTEETIQKAVKSANKGRNMKGQDLAKVTMELTVAGNGGSQVCDAVQLDYERLMQEKIKGKEGSEQNVSN